MRRNLAKTLAPVPLIVCAAALASCDRRPLETVAERAMKVRINVDWLSLYGEKPDGMSVFCYPADGGEPASTITNNVDYADVAIDEAGTYYVVVFNQSSGEFGSFDFNRIDLHDSIHTSATYIHDYQNGDWDKGVRYMRAPEKLGVALDTISITPNMIENYVEFHRYRKEAATGNYDDDAVELFQFYETAVPEVTSVNVRVRIGGINNLHAVKASLTGMSDGCMLSQTWRTMHTLPLLLDEWVVESDTAPATRAMGWVYTKTTSSTWGFMHGKELIAQRDSTDCLLTLNLTLINGEELIYKYQVGKSIHYRDLDEDAGIVRRRDTTRPIDLVVNAPDFEIPDLPDVKPKEGGGGFSADVDQWENGGTVDVGL